MICRFRNENGKCMNAEACTMRLNYPSERFCVTTCSFREPVPYVSESFAAKLVYDDGYKQAIEDIVHEFEACDVMVCEHLKDETTCIECLAERLVTRLLEKVEE